MCIEEKIKRLQKSPAKVLISALAAKALGGIGLGILFISYFPTALTAQNWIYAGWGLLALAVIIALAIMRELHRKRTIVEKISEKLA